MIHLKCLNHFQQKSKKNQNEISIPVNYPESMSDSTVQTVHLQLVQKQKQSLKTLKRDLNERRRQMLIASMIYSAILLLKSKYKT